MCVFFTQQIITNLIFTKQNKTVYVSASSSPSTDVQRFTAFEPPVLKLQVCPYLGDCYTLQDGHDSHGHETREI